MQKFNLISDYKPAGDQPKAIDALTTGITNNETQQVLLGVTGSGKTFTLANVIANLNRPTLVLAHNKTLAAQLCAEFREFFPDSAVEYFISYYDYYQPEAYVAHQDLYIEKEAQINEEIERLRHKATMSLLTRRDVIIVASVSCIYGLGAPEEYLKGVTTLKVGQLISPRNILKELERIQYERNDIELKNGRYRVKGDTIDIFPSWGEDLIRIELFGDEIERISLIHPLNNSITGELPEVSIFPATHYVVLDSMKKPIENIRNELKDRVDYFERQGRAVEAQRIKQRTSYDLEMMQEMGYCKGIENYARHISFKDPGEAPGVLIDFFPDDFITIVDESHVTLPQVRGMYNGDRARKQSLVEHGFRLPSALDNRPLNFQEFEHKLGPVIYTSATPGDYEFEKATQGHHQAPSSHPKHRNIIEQIIRPTGLLDPEIDIRKSKGQIDDLLSEIHKRVAKKERVLITTVTKQMSEDLTDFLVDKNIKVRYIHSDVLSLERIQILRDLRQGKFDVLVGVNLLREGLDLPEVSLVAILDADKEGFLRNERSLIQTMGRAARNANGRVILYADKLTASMDRAIKETNRRRAIQLAHNKKHNISPKTIIKKITDILPDTKKALKETENLKQKIAPKLLPKLIATLENQMQKAAKNLDFETAAVLRDRIEDLKSS